MFNQLTVRARLLSGFMLVAFLGAVVAGVSIVNMGTMNQQAEHAYHNDLLGISALKEANINLIIMGRAARNQVLARTPDERAKFLTMVNDARKIMEERLSVAKPLFTAEASKVLFGDLEKGLVEFEAARAQLQQLLQDDTAAGKNVAIDFVFASLAPRANYVDNKISEIADLKEKIAAAAQAETTQIYQQMRTVMMVLVLCSLGAGIMIGLWITRGLTRQLGAEPGYAVEVVDAIAAGELSQAIKLRSGDQDSLLFAMEAMRMSLVNIVGQVRLGTDTIATASNQIAAGNLDLSSRTEQQASSLEETASSMEELTSTVKQNADNARQAKQLAVAASEVARNGGTVVAKVVDTMASINASSRKIVDIIAVIDGIAFQTNILALNAAVEAARAGEQGRGFAVVATEVRNLAQRAAAAAKEIKTLIIDSVEKVDSGGKLVDQAGVTMADIVQSITRVTDMMSEIASASIEQTMGIEQINSAVSQMDEVTQQNAALVEQAAAAAGAMQEQAAALSAVVSRFKLGQEMPINASAPQRPRARVAAPSKPVPRLAASHAPSLRRAPPVTHGDAGNWEQF
ncbi:MAG: methyl-accepting chemotaxis protein [Sphingomonadaceae bacterium]